MKGIKHILTSFLLLALALSPLMAQSPISGVINEYSSIEELLFLDGSTTANAVRVSDPGLFAANDTVMFYTAKGFKVRRSSTHEGEISVLDPFGYAGNYTFLIVDRVNLDTVIFNNGNGFNHILARDYDAGEVGQLIRVPSYENAVVTGEINAKPWDGSTGGIVAMFVKKKLTLNAPIDVSGQGFRGADPTSDNYNGKCYNEDISGLDDFFYTAAAEDSAGLKGEGAADVTFPYNRGKAGLINGGGGGNAKYSGGGGGANYETGGNGGNESKICDPAAISVTNGKSGHSFSSEGLYANDDKGTAADNLWGNRVFLGGGGGAGTHTPITNESSKGGNGGGIVIIIGDTIQGTPGNHILAMGDPASSLSSTIAGAGGGGGAGGCIVLDVSGYQDTLVLNARGGNGGNTNGGVYSGPGGGGGGGIYWMRHDSSKIAMDFSKGGRGRWNSNTSGQAEEGVAPDVITDLSVPLAGFLFNSLPRDREVCSDETPPPLHCSEPKGGDDTYTYVWHYKPSGGSWTPDPGNVARDYVFSGPLTVTTQFRRTVSSGTLDPVSDSITYFVLQKIEGNGVLAHDTVCFGLAAIPFTQNPDSTLGGAEFGSDWNYRWIKSTDGGSNWADADGTFDQVGYATPGLTETTIYSRVIKSGVCDDTSNQVIVTVLPAIGNNSISQDTIICNNQTPDELIGTKPTGGDAGLFSYKWEMANNEAGPYAEVATTQNYQPPTLASDAGDIKNYYYRRIYYSGIQDACIDYTDTLRIEVLPSIANNDLVNLVGDTSICQYTSLPDPGAQGTQPTKGRAGQYKYTWQVSDDLASWTDAPETTTNQPFNQSFPDKRYIRRLVKSGENDVCQDFSDTLTVFTVDAVYDNELTIADFSVCQDVVLPQLTAKTATGGDGTYGILWEWTRDLGKDFSAATSAGGPNNQNNYIPDTLDVDTWFRRAVWSDAARAICMTYSDTLLVTVKGRIENNYLNKGNEGDFSDSICYNTNLAIIGSVESSADALSGGDGPGSYAYSWEKSPTPNDGDFVDAGSSTANYLENDLTIQQYYRRTVTSGVCTNTSDPLEIVIRELPTGVIALNNVNDAIICESDKPVELKVDLTGAVDATSYFIRVTYNSMELGTGTPGSDNIDTDNIVDNPGIIKHNPFTNDSATFIYTLNLIVDNNGCVAPLEDMTGSASLKVFQTPEAEINPRDLVECGPVASLAAVPDRGGVGHWIKQAGNVEANFSPLDNESTAVTISQLDNDTETLTYGWVLEAPSEDPDIPTCSDTAFITLTHYEDPDQGPYFAQDTIKMYFATNWALEAYEPTAGGGIWTIAEGSSGFVPDGSTSIITNATDLALGEYNTFVWTVRNPNIVDQEVCGPYRDTLSIRRMDVKQYDGFSPGEDDELNRYYTMKGLKEADDFTFTVFNSWGTPIKSRTMAEALEDTRRVTQGFPGLENSVEDELLLWDGTSADNITLVPDGAYYYQITIIVGTGGNALKYPKKGSILVKTRK